jgi:hypothetical protein
MKWGLTDQNEKHDVTREAPPQRKLMRPTRTLGVGIPDQGLDAPLNPRQPTLAEIRTCRVCIHGYLKGEIVHVSKSHNAVLALGWKRGPSVAVASLGPSVTGAGGSFPKLMTSSVSSLHHNLPQSPEPAQSLNWF